MFTPIEKYGHLKRSAKVYGGLYADESGLFVNCFIPFEILYRYQTRQGRDLEGLNHRNRFIKDGKIDTQITYIS